MFALSQTYLSNMKYGFTYLALIGAVSAQESCFFPKPVYTCAPVSTCDAALLAPSCPLDAAQLSGPLAGALAGQL